MVHRSKKSSYRRSKKPRYGNKRNKKRSNSRQESRIERIGGYLKEITTVFDHSGEVLHEFVKPLMVEFHAKDFIQVVVGASLLAMPIAFTEESWQLAITLPLTNVLLIGALGVIFVSSYVYYNIYKRRFKKHKMEYIKRVFSILVMSHFVVAVVLTLIQKCPWGVDNLLAIKRVMIVSFPASMSAAVSDTLK